jgi:hypothetical protein
MKKIDNFITKSLHLDENNLYNILTILDFDKKWEKESLLDYLNLIVEKNSILKNYIKKKENNFYWMEGTNFNINDFYTIENENYQNFDEKTIDVLNTKFLTNYKWHFFLYNDNENDKSRIFIKIDHSYCDGYNLIDILVTPLYPSYKKPEFKRKTNNFFSSLYYFIIGTLLLIFFNLKILWKLFFKTKNYKNRITFSNKKSNNIFCGKIKLEEIKNFTSKHKITVNTFLYSLMVKTWYNYNKTYNDNILSVSPINLNINNKNEKFNTNNIFFIFSEIEKYENNFILFQKVEDLFNLYKYSPFVPVANFVFIKFLPYLPESLQTNARNELFYNVNLSFSNIIGPKIDENNEYKLKNIQFTSVTKNSEVNFNMISFNDVLNINVSFRDEVIKDKNNFFKSFEAAYKNLLETKQ